MHTACLGLRRDEVTSYTPVRMTWLATASPQARAWFVRGVADSDGTVNLRNKTVVITSAPNTDFLRDILVSLGINTRTHESGGFGYVTISGQAAFELQIFNPEIPTHRGFLLQKMVEARTFQSRWPVWLQRRVASLLAREPRDSRVRDTLLFEDNIYVKLRTIRLKRTKNDGAGGGLLAR